MAQRKSAQRHADWIGMLQPEGLVVSVPVLDELELYVRQPQEVVLSWREATPEGRLPNVGTLAEHLGWRERFLTEAPEQMCLDLPDLHATVRPTHVLHDRRKRPVLLVQWREDDLDRSPPGEVWSATPTERFERLLTHISHPVGLQVTPEVIRLVYAPRGQAPGRLTFRVSDLSVSDGRLLIDALHMLLGARSLIAPPKGRALADVLERSRTRQEEVTNQLAAQVQEALEALLAGIDTANARTDGRLLRDVDDEALYGGLTTMLLRLVFVLYAEDRGLLPMDHPVYQQHYSVAALGEQLAQDAVAHGEAQSRRFGAWARVLSLSRMVWGGQSHRGLELPPRQGNLFHPDSYCFLEGRPEGSSHTTDPADIPPVDDAVVHGVLDRLLHLEGQRISYRNLEVEQLGSVYEALMGFEVRTAATEAVRLGNRCWVELGELAEAEHPYLLLQELTGERNARLRKQAPDLGDFVPTGEPQADRRAVEAALEPLMSRQRGRTPAGLHYLQPGAERRKSGSHYTPRALTGPLVQRTLAPLLGEAPTPDQVLALRICDPAMGSGAFLAEVVRQLSDALVAAWARTNTTPPSRHDPLVVARRRVAERCVYGVDKNPWAVQLARLSLWLITSTRDLPFTFVDHNLKAGDALVGLSFEQVTQFTYQPKKKKQQDLQTGRMQDAMERATDNRAAIIAEQRRMQFEADEHKRKVSFLSLAEHEVWDERKVADLLVACAWDTGRKTVFTQRLRAMKDEAWRFYPSRDEAPMRDEAEALLAALPMRPFHWWLEFPEVFSRNNPGFDAVVGNPPFGGKNTIVAQNGAPYIKWLQTLWPHAHGNADLCAYFFLRTERILRRGGWFSLVASNTIKQGNTLDTGLRYLVNQRPVTLVAAERDYKWPVKGVAVVVDRATGCVGSDPEGPFLLDGEVVDGISSELEPGEELPEPVKLAANANLCFQGSNVLGKGFVLTIEEAEQLLAEDPRRAEVVRPYIGGRELNNNAPIGRDEAIPYERYIISFGEKKKSQAAEWGVLFTRIEELVLPERHSKTGNTAKYWWRFERHRPELYESISSINRCLALSLVSKHLLFTCQPTDRIFSHKLGVVANSDWWRFASLQSRVHETWARSQSSTLETRLSYTPSRCFETFPFPRPTAEQRTALTATGEALYNARHAYMVAEQVGMTETWNRLHDPHNREPAIVELRELRDAMDRAVLAAYGWEDLDPDDATEIVARLRKLNAERAAEEAAQAAEEGR